MGLNIFSDFINHFRRRSTAEDYQEYNEFSSEYQGEVEDPMGGQEGITIYDRFNLDQDSADYDY